MTTGLFIGRFQPFHLGHLSDIKDALKEVDELVIAIGSSQHSGTKENPFSTEERIKMIEDTLIGENMGNYTIYPIPDIGNDKKWVEHVEVLIPKFGVVFTGNELTERLFKEKNYKVRRVKFIEGITATEIRKRMISNESWEELVPLEVIKCIEELDGASRVKDIFKR